MPPKQESSPAAAAAATKQQAAAASGGKAKGGKATSASKASSSAVKSPPPSLSREAFAASYLLFNASSAGEWSLLAYGRSGLTNRGPRGRGFGDEEFETPRHEHFSKKKNNRRRFVPFFFLFCSLGDATRISADPESTRPLPLCPILFLAPPTLVCVLEPHSISLVKMKKKRNAKKKTPKVPPPTTTPASSPGSLSNCQKQQLPTPGPAKLQRRRRRRSRSTSRGCTRSSPR